VRVHNYRTCSGWGRGSFLALGVGGFVSEANSTSMMLEHT